MPADGPEKWPSFRSVTLNQWGTMYTTLGSDARIAAHLGVFESFISEMCARCDFLIDSWLRRKREVWNELRGQITSRIIDTVRGLFLKAVYPEISLEQIAQMSHVTEGSIYRLFGDRAGLNAAVKRHTEERIYRFTRTLLAEHGASGVTLQDIAVGVSLPEAELRQLYSSMEELLKHVLRPKE
jgi:AcrR family transcriptional regulator